MPLRPGRFLPFFRCVWEVKTQSQRWICDDESLRTPQLITTKFRRHMTGRALKHTLKQQSPSSSETAHNYSYSIHFNFNHIASVTRCSKETLDPDPPNKQEQTSSMTRPILGRGGGLSCLWLKRTIPVKIRWLSTRQVEQTCGERGTISTPLCLTRNCTFRYHSKQTLASKMKGHRRNNSLF